MTARLAGFKEITVALPGIIDVLHGVGVVIPVKCDQERFYMDAFTLFCIALCFLSLADQARIHIFTLVSFHLSFFGQKGTRQQTRASVNNNRYSVLRETLA
jgi:hypothetical protein